MEMPLGDAEKNELGAILSELRSRIDRSSFSDAFNRYFQRMSDNGQIDLLRCYKQLFTSDDKELYFSIERAQETVQRYLNRHAAGFLTREMLEVEQRVDATTFDSAVSGPLCAYAFTHMEQTEAFLYLVEQRGIIYADEIEDMINEVDFDAHPSSLRGGLI